MRAQADESEASSTALRVCTISTANVDIEIIYIITSPGLFRIWLLYPRDPLFYSVTYSCTH
jgi:hypothetical protein